MNYFIHLTEDIRLFMEKGISWHTQASLSPWDLCTNIFLPPFFPGPCTLSKPQQMERQAQGMDSPCTGLKCPKPMQGCLLVSMLHWKVATKPDTCTTLAFSSPKFTVAAATCREAWLARCRYNCKLAWHRQCASQHEKYSTKMPLW